MDQFNANKPRRLWENREIFTDSAYGVIVVTGPTKTLVPAAVMGLVPRDRGAESELFLDCASLTSFYNLREPGCMEPWVCGVLNWDGLDLES